LRAARVIEPGEIISRDMIDVLRPAPLDAIRPDELDKVIGLKARVQILAGRELRWNLIGG
jgi:N-acetylneuraminate synthase